MTDEQCGAIRLLLVAMKATIEEQRLTDVVGQMDWHEDTGYASALEAAVEANRVARRARKAVTPEHLATLDRMLGECW